MTPSPQRNPLRGTGLTSLMVGLALFLLACSPTKIPPDPIRTGPTNTPLSQTTPPALETQTNVGGEETSPPTLSPTIPPTSTPEPPPSATFTPTPLPSPAFTHMGIEVVGENYLTTIPEMKNAGAGWIRYNAVFWANIEPQEGVRNWTQAAGLESRAQAVSEAGMNFIAIVLFAPAWAQEVPGFACGSILPEKYAAFGQFMHDLVARYSGPPYNIKYWELGNEPDIPPFVVPGDSLYGCWGNPDEPYYGGTAYAEMLKVVYPQIKAADPEAQVLVGGLLLDCDPNNAPLLASGESKDCRAARFMEGILQNGGGPYFDGISFHAYDYYWTGDNKFINAWRAGSNQGRPVVYYKTAYLRELLSRYGFPNKFLMNTETALLCGRDLGEAICATEEFQLTKANYVAQSFTVARGENLTANIWYHYQKGWRASGLVSKNLQPYPALNAYRFVSQMLDGTVPLLEIQEFPNVVGYQFIKPAPEGDQEIWVLWSSEGLPSTIHLPEAPSQMYDVLGQPLPSSQTVQVTQAVLYLIWHR